MPRHITAYVLFLVIISLLMGCQSSESPTEVEYTSACDIDKLHEGSQPTSPDTPEGALTTLGWGMLFDVAINPAGTCAVVLTSQGVRVFDLDSFQSAVLFTHKIHYGSVGWSPDGTRIAVAGVDNEVTIWDVATRQAAVIYEGETLEEFGRNFDGSPVFGESELAWSPDNAMLAISAQLDGITVINSESGEVIAKFEESTLREVISWLPDSTKLVAPHLNSVLVYTINPQSEEELFALPEPHGGIRALALYPDGDKIAIASGLGVSVVDTASGEELFAVTNGENEPTSVAWSPDGTMLLTGWSNRDALVSDALTGRTLHEIAHKQAGSVYEEPRTSVRWVKNRIVVTIGSTGNIQLTELGDELASREMFVSTHNTSVRGLNWAQDGSVLASTSADSQIALWDTSTYGMIWQIREEDSFDSADELMLSRDHTRLAVVGIENTSHSPEVMEWSSHLLVYDIASGERLIHIEEYRGDVLGIEWSDQDKALYHWRYHAPISLLNTTTQGDLAVWETPAELVWDVVQHSDGTFYATGSTGLVGKVGIWPVDRPSEVIWLDNDFEWVRAAHFSPDGSLLAVEGSGEITMWEAQTAWWRHTFRFPPETGPQFLAFSPDSRLLVIKTDDGLTIWDTATNLQVGTLATYARSAEFSPDGRLLATGHDDGTITLWEVERLIEPSQ